MAAEWLQGLGHSSHDAFDRMHAAEQSAAHGTFAGNTRQTYYRLA